MPPEAPLTLTAFKRVGGFRSWPEAVAVVLEVSDQITRAGDTLVTPDSNHIVFSHDGSLTILPGSAIPEHPVRQAATLLSELLRGIPAPVELRELVAENMPDPPACAWLEEFMTALAYFDRPGRPQIVSALVARAVLAQEATTRGSSAITVGPGRAVVQARPEQDGLLRRLLGRLGFPGLTGRGSD